MKKILKKATSGLIKLAGKGVVLTARAAPPVISGVAHFAKDLSSDSYYVFTGNKKKQKLITMLILAMV